MTLLRSVLAALLALFLYSTLAAQPADLRLSPPIYRASIPAEARVQASGRLGDVILVVWGSGANYGARDYGVLYSQIVRNGKAVGTPRMISTAELMGGYLQVIPLKDRFVVAWNDRRGATGSAYIRLLAPDGSPIGDEAMLHDRLIGGLMLAHVGDAMMLFWNDERDGGTVYSRTIGEDGALDAQTVERGRGVLEQGIALTGIPGYAIIHCGDRPPMIFDEEGREIAGGSWEKKFAGPFCVNDDGSIVAITHDTLLFFHTVLDTVPAGRSIVPLVPGAVDGSQVLSRGEDGLLQLFYAVSRQSFAGYGEEVAALLVRSVESPGGTFGPPELLRRFAVARPDKSCQTAAIDSLRPERSRIAGNGYQVSIAFHGANIYQCNGTYSALPLSSSLRYFIRGGAFGTDSLPGTILSGGDVRLVRVDGSDSSVVLVKTGAGTVRLAARSTVRTADFAQISPAIKLDKGELLMGWMSVEEDTVARLARWEYERNGVAEPLSVMSLAGTAWGEDSMMPLSWSHAIWRMEGEFLLERRSRWKKLEDGSEERHLDVFAPTLEGWTPLPDAAPAVSTSLSPVLGTAAFDPLTAETILGVRYVSDQSSIAVTDVLAFDSLYRPAWRLDSLVIDRSELISLIPLGSNDIMVGTSAHVVRFKDGALIEHYRPPALTSLYKRLLGPYFLRWEADGGTLTLTPFTLAGEMMKPRAHVIQQVPMTDPFITQNPADSTIIFLLGGTQGVRLIAVDRELRIRSGPVYVSDSGYRAARPAGVFRGDTLFVVWEDYRNGTPAIYGRGVTWERPVAGVGRTSGGAAEVMALRPLPANQRLLALFSAPLRSGSTLEIVDMAGAVRMTVPIEEGTAEREIDLHALPAGSYLARLRNASGITSRSFVIVR